MSLTRRQTLTLGATAVAGLAATPVLPRVTLAQQGTMQTYATASGEISIHPVNHASLAIKTPGLVIYADPVGAPAAYSHLPPPDLILVTHEHGDHFNAETLAALAGDNTKLITNPSVHGKLPAELAAKAAAIANGDSTEVGGIAIDAIPAYNSTPDRQRYHPEGRDNGYVLTIDGRRVYIAGDTEDIPAMRALTDIMVAFLPMLLPFTMSIEQAASAVAEFKPAHIYPYHYMGTDTDAFAALVAAQTPDTEVVLIDWYAGSSS